MVPGNRRDLRACSDHVDGTKGIAGRAPMDAKGYGATGSHPAHGVRGRACSEPSKWQRPKHRCSISWPRHSVSPLPSCLELLLADSSRAHFRQVLVSPSAGHDTGVRSAVARGLSGGRSWAVHGLSLEHRDGRLPATYGVVGVRPCALPVSISGNSVGVFHVTAAEGSAPSIK